MHTTHTREKGREGGQKVEKERGREGKAGEERRKIGGTKIGGTKRVLVGKGACSYPCLFEASEHLSESKVNGECIDVDMMYIT